MNIQQRYIICSVDVENSYHDRNQISRSLFNRWLAENKIGYKKVKGYYKGIEEVSYLIPVKSNEQLDKLRNKLFLYFGQESFLESDSNGQCYLEFISGEIKKLGKMRQVSNEEAAKLQAYTIIEGNNYATK